MTDTIEEVQASRRADDWSATLERSEGLDAVMALVGRLQSLHPVIADIFQLHAILDSSIIVEDLICLAKTHGSEHRRPAIYELAGKRTLIAYFPLEKLSEVEEKCREISERYDFPLHVVKNYWAKYLQRLHLVPTYDLERDRPDVQALAARDPTDVPFLQARHLVGASVVISKDRDIAASGAPTMAWSNVLVDLRHYSRKHGLKVGIYLATGTAIVAPIGAFIGCIRSLCNLAKKIPREVLVGMALLIVAALLFPPTREAIVRTGQKLRANVGRIATALHPVITEACRAAVEAEKQSKKIMASIDERMPVAIVKNKPSLSQACYRACLLAPEPLTTQEVWQMAQRYGASSRAKHPLRSVKAALRRHSRLIGRTPDGGWRSLPTAKRITAHRVT